MRQTDFLGLWIGLEIGPGGHLRHLRMHSLAHRDSGPPPLGNALAGASGFGLGFGVAATGEVHSLARRARMIHFLARMILPRHERRS